MSWHSTLCALKAPPGRLGLYALLILGHFLFGSSAAQSEFRTAYTGAKSVRSARSQKDVLVLVAAWCPYCRALEEFLRSRDIHYTRYDIEQTAKGAMLYKRYGSSGVPLVIIGKQEIRGFNPAAILQALE